MNKYVLTSLLVVLLGCSVADAQIGIMMGPRYGYGPRPRRRPQQNQSQLPKFQPSVNVSLGYGFPNLDQYELVDFYSSYKGSVSQTGPLTAAVDYQFSRTSSIGVMVTHGTVSVPYYDYSGSATTPSMTGSLDNWAIMLDFVRYMPVNGDKVSPYIRTAIGINTWNQNYTSSGGSQVPVGTTPSILAYQLGIGAKFNLTKHSGIFLEAGYGKYILHGGLAFKF